MPLEKKKTKKTQTTTEMTVKVTIVTDGDQVLSLSKEDWAENIKALIDADDVHVTELKNFTI